MWETDPVLFLSHDIKLWIALNPVVPGQVNNHIQLELQPESAWQTDLSKAGSSYSFKLKSFTNVAIKLHCNSLPTSERRGCAGGDWCEMRGRAQERSVLATSFYLATFIDSEGHFSVLLTLGCRIKRNKKEIAPFPPSNQKVPTTVVFVPQLPSDLNLGLKRSHFFSRLCRCLDHNE